MILGIFTKGQVWWADFRQRVHDEDGVSAVEYGLLVVLIAVVIVAIVGILGGKVSANFHGTGSGGP